MRWVRRLIGREQSHIGYRGYKLGRETAAEQKRFQPLLESLQRRCWSDANWQTVPHAWSSSRKRPITDGVQPSWRYDQCRRWRQSQSLPWTDVIQSHVTIGTMQVAYTTETWYSDTEITLPKHLLSSMAASANVIVRNHSGKKLPTHFDPVSAMWSQHTCSIQHNDVF